MVKHFVAAVSVLALAAALGGPAVWAANGATYVSDNIPTTMTTGATYTPTVTMLNSGTTTWTSSPLPDAQDYNFGPPDIGAPNPASTWGLRTDVGPTPVAPTEQYTFTLSITAPNVPGTYIDCRWQMVQEQVEWFGDAVAKTITVNYVAPVWATENFDSYTIGALQPQGPPAGTTLGAWNVQEGANTDQVTVVAPVGGSYSGANAAQIWFKPGNARMNITDGPFSPS